MMIGPHHFTLFRVNICVYNISCPNKRLWTPGSVHLTERRSVYTFDYVDMIAVCLLFDLV